MPRQLSRSPGLSRYKQFGNCYAHLGVVSVATGYKIMPGIFFIALTSHLNHPKPTIRSTKLWIGQNPGAKHTTQAAGHK